MRTLILKPVFRKKAFQRYSWWKIIFLKNSAKMSNLGLPAWKSVAGVDANHLMFCLFSDTSSFMMFSSAVLLLHDRTWSICTKPVTFLWTSSPGTRLAGHMTWFNLMEWQRIFARSFLFQIFPHLFKKPKDMWVDRTLTKPKGKIFMEFTLSSKYSRKCKIFSIMILNLSCMTNATDRLGLKWCTKLNKLFVLIYFY